MIITLAIYYFRSPDEPFPDLEKEFEPNLLNSKSCRIPTSSSILSMIILFVSGTVYMISMTLQLATFAINYRVSDTLCINILTSTVYSNSYFTF